MQKGIRRGFNDVKFDSIVKCFIQNTSPQTVKEYIDFIEQNPNNKNISWHDLYSFNKYSEIEKVIYRLDVSIEKFNKWMFKQIDNFNLGVLPVSGIEKLKIVGFFDGMERFNDEDLKTIELYFKNDNNTQISQGDIKSGDWQLKIAKYFVMNYYYRKPNQQYELSDYINEIVVNTINYANENENIDIPTLKRYILDKIKEYNEKNIIDKSDHKKNEEDSYDNIDSLINNMENNEMLTYNLIYLSVIEPKIYQTFCDYCGVKLENNKLVSTANDFKSLKEVANDNKYSPTTIKKHIEIASNILKNDRSVLGKMILQQEDYVVVLLKSLFSSRSMTNENKRNYFSNIINLFNEKIYDDKLIEYIRTIINESIDDSLLQYKSIIEKRLVEIEQKHYGKDNNDIINEESTDNSEIDSGYQSDESNGKHL